MKITTVTYSRTYPTGLYANEKIGVEATIDETDNVDQVFDMLKGICDGQHKSNNPHLYTETQTSWQNEIIEHGKSEQQIPPSTPKTQPHSTIEAINSCTTLKVLQEFDLIVQNMGKKYPEIQEAYQQKLTQLTENK